MAQQLRRRQPEEPGRLVTLAVALIFGTALLALAVVVGAAKATTTKTAPTRTAGLPCRTDDRGDPWPTKPRAGVRTTLVPSGAVALTVCRYNGMNAFGGVPRFGLRGVGATNDRSTVAHITAALDALEATHGIFHCPMDDDSRDVATFSYPSGPPVVVTVGTNGCNAISNGHIHRLGLGKPVVAEISFP